MGRPIRKGSIRCQCGYCGKDSTSGMYFVPTRSSQKYFNTNHYLRKMYNGKLPMKKKCNCGCNRIFYTVNPEKFCIKGHEEYLCDLCQKKLNKDNVRKFRSNLKDKINICEECYEKVQKDSWF